MMDALCKARLPRKRIRTAFGHALHSGLLLSTGSRGLAVQTVGKGDPNRGPIAALPPFPFLGTLFSKTGRRAIPAVCLVTNLLSTFPAQTATATNKEEIFYVFCRSRGFWFHVIHRINTVEILRQLRGGVE